LVAEMKRQIDIETERLFPRRGDGRDAIRNILGSHFTSHSPELRRLEDFSVLRSYLRRIWRHLTDEGAAGRLQFSYQPSEPTATRMTLAADRVRHIAAPSIGCLFVGRSANALLSAAGVAADTLILDGHELLHVRITRVSVEVGCSTQAEPRGKAGNPGYAIRNDTLVEIALRIAEGWDNANISRHIRKTWQPMQTLPKEEQPPTDTVARWIRRRRQKKSRTTG
jgi:hypothetical protein